jgi:hypothetical protein
MQKWWAVFEIALVGTTAALGGCGDDDAKDSETGRADASGPADAGCPAVADAGCPAAADAGCPAAADAGCPAAADAGCPAAADAGCPAAADAGCPAAAGATLPSDPNAWSAFLSSERYKEWRCDPTPQPKISDSPHGDNIICVNDILWQARSGTGEWPVGSAAVKLTFDSTGVRVGQYIDARLRADDGAAGWYFYVERGPKGYGNESATTFCASCHDNDGARDYVRRIPGL